MIKAVIFDMMGPLLQKRAGYKIDEVVQMAESLSSQNLGSDQFIDELKKNEITKNFSIDKIARRVTGKYRKVPKIWDELLPKLRRTYKLAVINNGMSITIPYFKKQHPFDKFFSVFINSSEENLGKPNPDIFHLACNRLGVVPSECIFIDDTDLNVEGSKKIGMNGIIWKDYASLVKRLKFCQKR